VKHKFLNIFMSLVVGLALTVSGVIGPEAVYAADGDLDNTFSYNGMHTSDYYGGDDRAHGVAVQADGKIVVVGVSDPGGGQNFEVARYLQEGTLDSSGFGAGDGVVILEFGGEDIGRDVAVQSDGKIVVVGSVYQQHDDGPNFDFGVARLNSDGTLDRTFGGPWEGTVTVDFQGSDEALDVEIQSDGKIVVAGYTREAGVERMAVVRLNSDGTLDPTFGQGGKVTVSCGQYGCRARAAAIQSSGKIVLAGHKNLDDQFVGDDAFAIVRLNADGTPDMRFGANGRVYVDFGTGSDAAQDIALQTDGKIVAVGYVKGTTLAFGYVRLNGSGILDATFSGDGKATVQVLYESGAYAVVMQADGKIVAAGIASYASGRDAFAFVRLNVDGTLDTTFSDDGKAVAFFGDGSSQAWDMAIQPDGKVVAVGQSDRTAGSHDFALVRLQVPTLP
jgi:uncharacterized delta-60 repeat protein